jgi:hypothetical protein
MKNKRLRRVNYLPLIVSVLLIAGFSPAKPAKAEAASAVAVGTINYEELTLQVYNNSNSIVYYSTNGDDWTELEGAYDNATKSYTMDISWIAAKNDMTLYFKGDVATNTVYVTLPMQDTEFSVIYDKAECDFTFITSDDAEFFEWRKAVDYYWNRVSLNDESASYQSFLNTMEIYRAKGIKLVFRIPQVIGTADNAGSRPSKEVAVTITARAEAPSVTVNPSKLTINTTTAMEYYDAASASWIECEKAMTLDALAPGVLYENGSHDATLMIRKAATASAPYSKTAYVTIKGQAGAPQIGDNSKDVTYYFVNSKLAMVFNNASATNAYEYTVVKYDATFDAGTARWSTVNSTKLITLSAATAPNGCTIYVRKKGIEANATKNTELVLSSAAGSFTVRY